MQSRRGAAANAWKQVPAGDDNRFVSPSLPPTSLQTLSAQGYPEPLRTGCMAKNTYRVVTRAADGSLRIKDYPTADRLMETHTQIGIDDCSTDLELRGLPVFRGLVGPMPEGKNVIRYESPEVFETLTKEWSAAKTARRSRRRTAAPEAIPAAEASSL